MAELRRDWYVIYSKPRKEEQVQFHLGLRGIESFFPKIRFPCGARKRRLAPLFPNYLFVRMDVSVEAYCVVWSPGVKRIVSTSDHPIPVEDSVIEFLRGRADQEGVIQAHSQLNAGQQVEINGGPFDGFIGIIENPPNAKGRVKVLLKLLSRQISVKLSVECIRDHAVTIAPSPFRLSTAHSG